MTEYLSYEFKDTEDFIETFDEAPLWSAAFGLLLLKHLGSRKDMTVVDIGSGAGFPLMELAARLGSSCQLYGVDPWVNANKRAQKKIRNYGLDNVAILETSAEKIPLEDHSVDLVVSNLGINNFEEPAKVFRECHRVMKQGARLALTTNLDGHWKEFYSILEDVVRQLGYHELLPGIQASQEHRGTAEGISRLFTENGFKMVNIVEEKWEMNFLDGSAFLNHYFVKLGWLGSWRELMPKEKEEEIFRTLEDKLNEYAWVNGILRLTVPMAYIEGEKV